MLLFMTFFAVRVTKTEPGYFWQTEHRRYFRKTEPKLKNAFRTALKCN